MDDDYLKPKFIHEKVPLLVVQTIAYQKRTVNALNYLTNE